MSDNASAEPWDGPSAVAELTVEGHVFVLDRETAEEVHNDLHECLARDEE